MANEALDPREQMWWELAVKTCSITENEWYEIFSGTIVAVDAELNRLRAELTQARNENLTLHARMGQIVDTATMPMPEYWHPRIG